MLPHTWFPHDLLVVAVAALIPLVVGALWYSPFLFAKPWAAATGITEEKMKSANMAANMVKLYIFSFLIAYSMLFTTIHQFGLNSMMGNPKTQEVLMDPNSQLHKDVASLLNSAGGGDLLHSFRTYKHGAFHGILAAILLALPLIGSCAVFEQRSVKYVLITWGFWLINFALIGAVVCRHAWTPLDGPFHSM